LAPKGGQLAHELWHYKDSPSPAARSAIQRRLTAVLWRFLEVHEPCVAAALAVTFSVVTVVPSCSGRAVPHPLELIVARGIQPTATRYRQLLAAQAARLDREFDRDRFIATERINGPVLLIDDTWTKGSRAQAAAFALKRAGAPVVAVIVIGRHIDPGYRDNAGFLAERHRLHQFDWDWCCLQG
jgi:hypothetical protein